MTADASLMTRWVYAFGGGAADGDASMKDLLGGKGANLAEMSALGLPVPPGFTITTEACVHYYSNDTTATRPIWQAQVAGGSGQDRRSSITGKTFGDRDEPPAGFRPFRGACVHARHDGYRPQPRSQ